MSKGDFDVVTNQDRDHTGITSVPMQQMAKPPFTPEVPAELIAKEKEAQAAAQKAAKPPVFAGVFAYFPLALKEVARVSKAGADKRGLSLADKGFLDPKYTIEAMDDARARHELDLAIEGEINHLDGDVYHRAQIAWNALATLERVLRDEAQMRFAEPLVPGDYAAGI